MAALAVNDLRVARDSGSFKRSGAHFADNRMHQTRSVRDLARNLFRSGLSLAKHAKDAKVRAAEWREVFFVLALASLALLAR
jgi:hypothetical protein